MHNSILNEKKNVASIIFTCFNMMIDKKSNLNTRAWLFHVKSKNYTVGAKKINLIVWIWRKERITY